MPLTSAEVSARYYAKHHEKRLAYAKTYRATHKPWLSGRSKEYQRAYAKEHREQHRAADRKWREKNRPRRNAVAKQRRDETKKRTAEIKKRNLALLRAVADKLRRGGRDERV
jgi:hypothetical protein